MRCQAAVTLLLALATAAAHHLSVGLLVPTDDLYAPEAVGSLLALHHARDGNYSFSSDPQQAPPLSFNVSWTLYALDSDSTSSAVVAAALTALNDGVDVLVGPRSSAETTGVQPLATVYGTPEVSYSATASELSDTGEFPFFSRVVPADVMQGAALAALFDSLGITHVNCLSNDDTYGQGLVRDFQVFASERGIDVDVSVDYSDADSLSVALEKLRDSNVRVILFAANEAEAAAALGVANGMGMMSDEFVWVGTDGVAEVVGADLSPELAAHGLLCTQPDDEASSAPGETWAGLWDALSPADFPELDAMDATMLSAAAVPVKARFAYDAVWHALWGFEALTRAGGAAGDYQSFLVNRTFDGVTGSVEVDENGDRVGGIQFLNLAPGNLSLERVGAWSLRDGVALEAAIVWPGGSTVTPSDLVVACEVGQKITVDSEGEPFCVTCPAGSFNVDGDGECYDCPAGAVCDGGSDIRALKDYWQYELDFYQCLPGMCCPDGGCNTTAACAAHREGVLCGACAPGFTAVEGDCVACDGANVGVIALYVLATSALVVWAVRQPRKTASSAVVKICVGFIQIVSLVLPSFDEGGSDLARLLNLQPSDLGGTASCIFPMGAHTHAAATILVTLLIACEMAAGYVIHLVWHRLQRRQAHRGNWIRGAWRLLFICYTSIVQTGLLMLVCRDVGPYTVLTSYPDVACWEGAHVPMAVGFGGLFFFGAVVVPAFIVVFLHRSAKRRRLLLSSEEAAVVSLNHATLFAAYRPRFRLWYEAVFLTRRTVFAIVYAFLSLHLLERQTTFFILSVALLVAHLQTKPYLTRSDNSAETYFLVVLCFLAGIELVGVRTDNTDDKPAWVRALIPVVLVGAVCGLVLRVLYIRRVAGGKLHMPFGKLENEEEDRAEVDAAMQAQAVKGGDVKEAISLRGYHKRATKLELSSGGNAAVGDVAL